MFRCRSFPRRGQAATTVRQPGSPDCEAKTKTCRGGDCFKIKFIAAEEKNRYAGPGLPRPTVDPHVGDDGAPVGWSPWHLGSATQPLAREHAAAVAEEVPRLSSAWRARVQDVVTDEGAEPLLEANSLLKGCCRRCGWENCLCALSAARLDDFLKREELLRQLAMFGASTRLPHPNYLIQYLKLFCFRGRDPEGEPLQLYWLLLVSLKRPVWPIFTDCTFLEVGDERFVKPNIPTGIKTFSRAKAELHLTLPQLDAVDLVEYTVVELLKFKLTDVTDITEKLKEKKPRRRAADPSIAKTIAIALGGRQRESKDKSEKAKPGTGTGSSGKKKKHTIDDPDEPEEEAASHGSGDSDDGADAGKDDDPPDALMPPAFLLDAPPEDEPDPDVLEIAREAHSTALPPSNHVRALRGYEIYIRGMGRGWWVVMYGRSPLPARAAMQAVMLPKMKDGTDYVEDAITHEILGRLSLIKKSTPYESLTVHCRLHGCKPPPLRVAKAGVRQPDILRWFYAGQRDCAKGAAGREQHLRMWKTLCSECAA